MDNQAQSEAHARHDDGDQGLVGVPAGPRQQSEGNNNERIETVLTIDPSVQSDLVRTYTKRPLQKIKHSIIWLTA